MGSTIHARALTVAAVLVAVGALAPAAASVSRTPAYGKPGSVKIIPVAGGVTNDKPTIVVPKHTIRRSPKAPHDSQKICTTFQVLVPATPPATGWVVKSNSKSYCAWNLPGSYELIGDYPYVGDFGVNYHVRYIVTWATKKKKKLARATYDFNELTDYKCTSTHCLIDQGADNVPFISFFK